MCAIGVALGDDEGEPDEGDNDDEEERARVTMVREYESIVRNPEEDRAGAEVPETSLAMDRCIVMCVVVVETPWQGKASPR